MGGTSVRGVLRGFLLEEEKLRDILGRGKGCPAQVKYDIPWNCFHTTEFRVFYGVEARKQLKWEQRRHFIFPPFHSRNNVRFLRKISVPNS